MQESHELWSRVKRVSAYDAPRRARYASLGRTADDQIVCLFTRASEDQEAAGTGEIVSIRSADRGQSWTEPTTVYPGRAGEPRTMGTLATLSSDQLVAAVVEMGDGPRPQAVRLVTSRDGGRNWDVSGPLEFGDVEWACPHGSLFEAADGALIMPVHAARSAANVRRDVLCCGLMRSVDGGQSWGDFSVIAADPEISFTQPAVVSLPDGSLVAMVSGDAQHEGDQPMPPIYRCYSEDGGYHWTDPQQTLVGRQSHLVRIDDTVIACIAAKGAEWRLMVVSFSYDNGRNWRCDRKVVERCRAPGQMGSPTAVALDAEHLIIAFGHTQFPVPQLDGPASSPVSEDEERIEIVFFERDREIPEFPQATKITPPSARDCWHYDGERQHKDWPGCFCKTAEGEFIGIVGGQASTQISPGPVVKYEFGEGTVEELRRSSDGGRTWQRHPVSLPTGFRGGPSLITRLSSGRLLCAIVEWLESQWNDVDARVVGQRGGYALWNPDRKFVDRSRMFVIRSDDDGESWTGTDKPIDFSPFHWAVTNSPFIERADGTIVLPIWGCVTEQDGRERLDGGGLLRSTNGGETWGDFSMIAYDKVHRWTAYNEAVIAPVADDLWVAFMRTEYRTSDNGGAWTSRAVSTDGGYTWSGPEVITLGGAFGAQILPDGGMAVGHSGGLHLTYDLGRTWTRLIPIDAYVVPILLDDDTLLLAKSNNLSAWGTFDCWRRIPGGG